MNPVKARMVGKPEDYEYSSCKEYMENMGKSKSKVLYDALGIEDYKEAFSFISNEQYYMDIDGNEDEKLIYLLNEYQNQKNMKLENIIKNKSMFKEMIEFLHNEGNIKYINIAEKLSISKTTFFKLKK